jgi:predicted transcriptional regulator
MDTNTPNTLTIQLPKEMRQAVEAAAARTERSASGFVRAAIKEALARDQRREANEH